jgi:hypothetical protein
MKGLAVMKGSVDQISSEGSVGWLYAAAHGQKPLVQAFLRHRLIGQAVADLYRPDLEQVGLGDGRHGFDIRFNEPIDHGHLPFITLQPEGFDLTIPAHSGTGFLDIVRHIQADYPTTGRNRSVLGGLWTDRLDAAAVLAGRVAVGTVPAETQTALADLVAHGHVVLHGAMAARPLSDRELDLIDIVHAAPREAGRLAPDLRNALSSLASFVFNAPVTALLRAVFDDHPVAYRLDVLRTAQPGFSQACAIEALPSPAECALLYVAGKPGARLELVRDSHELAEFSQDGKSRWTAQGSSAVRDLVVEGGGSIEVVDLELLDMVMVGPGLVHRLVASEEVPVARILVAPRRVTPKRFLVGPGSWLESSHASGARFRL